MKNIILLLTIFTCINYSNLLIAQPTITSFSPSSGSVGTLVTIQGSNLNSPTAFSIGGVPAIIVSNTGTTLVGMVMPGATSNSISISTSGGSVSSNINFTVKSTLYPYYQQGNKLVGIGAVDSRQGASVSISADGNTAIVGGIFDNSSTGAVWIYTRNGGAWSQQGIKLVGTGAVGAAQQGTSVSISADGNTAIVGGAFDNSKIGAVWIFTRNGFTWMQQGNKLVGTGALGAAQQGTSVSISADGNTAIVGGYYDNQTTGATWIWTRNGSIWTQQGNKLVGTGAVGAAFQGTSVSISADGNTAIVGGYNDNSGTGAAWIYTRIGNTWTQQGSKLNGSGSIGAANQGSSVSISADGNTAIVGGSNDSLNKGATWIYTRSGNTWTQQGNKLVGAGGTKGPSQGSSVSISADGNTAIVGGYNDNSGIGAAWIFTRTGNTWTQQGNKLVGSGAIGAASQGSVSISADGNTAIVGGNYDNSGIGAAWINISYISNIIGTKQSVCTGYPNIILTGNTPTGLIAPYKYKWLASSVDSITGFGFAGGNDSSQNYSSNSLTQNAWFRRIVSSGNNIDTSVAIAITVNPKPNVGFTINNIAQCLSKNSFVFNDTSNISSGSLTRLWSFGDATTSINANTTKNYSGAGNFQVKLVVASNNNCKDSASKTVTVYPQPKSGFTINIPSQCLIGNSFSFNDTTTNSVSRFWDLGDLTSNINDTFSKTYTNAGTYNVKLKVTDAHSCTDSSIKVVTVKANPAKPLITAITKSLLQSTVANSYQWYQNGNAISGATNQTLPITNNGSYVVSIDSANGCSNLSNPYNASSVGINSLSVKYEISIYPNPTYNILNISFAPQYSSVTINICDVQGRILRIVNTSNNNTQIDVSDLSKGIYYINFSSQEMNITSKFIIND
jgi:hypothetical protein